MILCKFAARLGAGLIGFALLPAVASAAGTPNLTGRYEGNYRIHIYGCPGACNIQEAVILGRSAQEVRWDWNFDDGTVEMAGTTLDPVGFHYEVQDWGNASPAHNRAQLVDNGDGTYTVYHGFQIYNPSFNNPRTETFTTFRITRDETGRRLTIETLDGDGDGVPGTQVVGVFPMTVNPMFVGFAYRFPSDNNLDGISDYDAMELGLNPDVLDSDGDGESDRAELEILPGNLVLSQPRDTDRDGVIDALEPGDRAGDPRMAGDVPLLGGPIGFRLPSDPLSGETVVLGATDWRFYSRFYPNANYRAGVMATGKMVDPNNAAGYPESLKSNLGDPGLNYLYGWTRFTLLPDAFTPRESGQFECSANRTPPAVVTHSVRATLRYSAALPPPQKLLVYAEEWGGNYITGRASDFTLLDPQYWRRVDDHTLEISLPFDSKYNLASLYLHAGSTVYPGCILTGSGGQAVETLVGHAFVGSIAPTENTLGAIDRERDPAVGGGGSFGPAGLVGLLLLLALRNRRVRRSVRGLPLLMLSGLSFAQTPAQETEKVLPKVTVTPDAESEGELQIQEQKAVLEKVPGATNLINMEEQKGSQVSLARVLSSQPGIIVQEFFGGNDQPRVNIRGSGIQDNPVSRGIQLLYDGLPMNQADGSFIIGLLDPEQARYISVWRGANAMRYGATTLGGAIDFGLRNARNNESSSVRLEAGSWGLRKYGATLQAAGERADIYLQGAHSGSDGWRDHSEADRDNLALNVGFTFKGGENRSYVLATDNHFNAPFLLSKEVALSDPRSVLGDGDSKFDEYMDIRKRKPWRDTQQLRLANKTTLWHEWGTQTLGLYGEKISDELKSPVILEMTEAINYGLDYGLEYNRHAADGRLMQVLAFLSSNLGWMPRAFDSIAPSDGRLLTRFAEVDQKAANIVGGAQVLYEFVPRWQALVALQLAHNRRKITDLHNDPGVLDSRFRYSAINPKIGLIFLRTPHQRFFANLSGSSEAPTFWQLAVSTPNPNAPLDSYLQIADLKMQTARTVEVGTASESERFSWEAAWYYAWVEDELIAEVKDFAIDGTTVNYDHPTRHQGLELAFNAHTRRGLLFADDELSVRGVYNWSDFRFHGGRYDGKRVADVPEHLLFGEIGYELNPRWRFSVDARWQPTSTYVDHSNSGLQLDDYLLLGAKLVWKPHRAVEMFVDARNLTGTTYQTAYVVRGFSPDDPNAPTFVPGPDFHFSAGFSWRW